MGLSTALYTGVSGLNANGTDLSVIGNDLANTNTVGYKGGRASFADILSSSAGGGSTMSVGRGVNLQAVTTQFTQGTLQTTSNALDLAIEGDGFFIVREASGAQYYTRAGQYKLDKSGDIVNPEGLNLQGYLTQQGGVLGTINVSSLNSPPLKTANVTVSANLNSATAVNDPTTATTFTLNSANNQVVINGTTYTLGAGTYSGSGLAAAFNAVVPAGVATMSYTGNDAAPSAANEYKFKITNTSGAGLPVNLSSVNFTAASMLGFPGVDYTIPAAGTYSSLFRQSGFDPLNATNTSDFSTSITVYDSLGNSHLINVYFRKVEQGGLLINPSGASTTGNRWLYWAVVPQTDSVVPAPPNNRLQVGGAGYLEFDTSGKLVFDSNGTSEYTSFNFLGGVTQAQSIAFNFGQSLLAGGSGLSGTTQFGNPNSVLFQNQDGYTAGSLQSLLVDQNGAMTGVFTNGQTSKVADVALARFIAPTELTKSGRNLYNESSKSGSAIIGTASTSGRGRIFANSLEASNVDIAEAFVKMIAAQRGFQANTKVISATDELLQELENIKR